MTLLVYISCNGLLCVKYARLYVFSEPYFRYTERSRFCPDTAKYRSKKTPVLAYIRSGTINKTRQYQTFSLTSCTWQFDLSTKYYHRLINLPWRFCFELQIRLIWIRCLFCIFSMYLSHYNLQKPIVISLIWYVKANELWLQQFCQGR